MSEISPSICPPSVLISEPTYINWFSCFSAFCLFADCLTICLSQGSEYDLTHWSVCYISLNKTRKPAFVFHDTLWRRKWMLKGVVQPGTYWTCWQRGCIETPSCVLMLFWHLFKSYSTCTKWEWWGFTFLEVMSDLSGSPCTIPYTICRYKNFPAHSNTHSR